VNKLHKTNSQSRVNLVNCSRIESDSLLTVRVSKKQTLNVYSLWDTNSLWWKDVEQVGFESRLEEWRCDGSWFQRYGGAYWFLKEKSDYGWKTSALSWLIRLCRHVGWAVTRTCM